MRFKVHEHLFREPSSCLGIVSDCRRVRTKVRLQKMMHSRSLPRLRHKWDVIRGGYKLRALRLPGENHNGRNPWWPLYNQKVLDWKFVAASPRDPIPPRPHAATAPASLRC